MTQPLALAASLEGPAGAPVLVLGNSLGTTGEVWEPQAAALGERFRLLRFEHRGHGGSPSLPGPYTIAELGADVLRLLDGFGVPTASYCGISLGGMIGMWLAAHAPERIGALALCCTSAYLPPAGFWTDRAAQARTAGMASLAEPVVGRWFTPVFRARDPATVGRFVTTVAGVDRRVTRAAARRSPRWTSGPRSGASPPPRWSSPGPRTRRPRPGTGPG